MRRSEPDEVRPAQLDGSPATFAGLRENLPGVRGIEARKFPNDWNARPAAGGVILRAVAGGRPRLLRSLIPPVWSARGVFCHEFRVRDGYGLARNIIQRHS